MIMMAHDGGDDYVDPDHDDDHGDYHDDDQYDHDEYDDAGWLFVFPNPSVFMHVTCPVFV